jgi:class 3 adenylate cyclase
MNHPATTLVNDMVAEVEALKRGDFRQAELPAAEGDLGKLAQALNELSSLLEARFNQLHRLLLLTEQINAGLVIDDVLEQVFVSFRDVIPFDRIGVALLDDTGERVKSRWARSLASTIQLPVGYSAPLIGSSLQKIILTGEPRVLNDLEAYLATHPDSKSSQLIVAEGVRSSLTCPLTAMGKHIGFMFFSSFKKNTYRQIHVDLFREIAGQLSTIIEKGRIYEMVLKSKKQSDRLLLNVLPNSIATRLKLGETRIADWHSDATILFADIVGFTAISSRMSAESTVATLNRVFSAFDALCEFHGVEKIKTIGDAYMLAAGIPVPREDHVEVAAQLALDMLELVKFVSVQEHINLDVRIGMASGPVVAGVIGVAKFSYDVWGDTVNMASRMESNGVPGRIQVTADVHDRLRKSLVFEERGTLDLKGIGSTRCYFVKAATASSVYSSGVTHAVTAMRQHEQNERRARKFDQFDAIPGRFGG